MNNIPAPAALTPVTAFDMVLVTETWPPEINGVAMTLSRLVDGMTARNWRVRLVRPRQRGEADSSDSQASQHVLVPGIPIPGYAGLRFGMPMLQKLRESWQRQPPQVVHIATEGPLGWAALKAARSLSIPVTSSFHTNFDHYCKHYRLGILRGMVTRHLRVFHNQSALTMVPNASLRQMLQRENYRNVVVLGRGVDGGLFSPQRRSLELRRQWGLAEGELAVIYVGRLAAEKNLGLVIRAFDAIQAVRPNARMVWVGDGPQLKKLQKKFPQHLFCGPQIGHALAAHYASADLFLFASMTETFGNVVVEAMASGLAVVAYDYAAAAMVMRHGENGLLADFGNQDDFIRQSLQAIQSLELLRSLGRKASSVAQQHSWQTVCDQFDRYLKMAVLGTR